MKKIAIIREEKFPPDSRVAITPVQCKNFLVQNPETTFAIQPSQNRCFTDDEYSDSGLVVTDNIHDCDIFLGIKEVPVDALIPDKTYLFFSHTIKAQPYNRKLLQEVLKKNIRLIDYECLLDENGERIIAFGRFAGIVGAHNGLMAYGKKKKLFDLKPAYQYKDLNELFNSYKSVKLPKLKIALTGSGRVAKGCAQAFEKLKIQKVSPEELLNNDFSTPVYTMLEVNDLYAHNEKEEWDVKEFYQHPERFKSRFSAYIKVTDLMVNAIYWDPKAPVFFSLKDMNNLAFNIKVIADITCDIEGSVPATIRSSTIKNPVYGFDPEIKKETEPYLEHTVDIMAVDNLPNELPRDASEAFGDILSNKVLPLLLSDEEHKMIIDATIAKNGQLTEKYLYLKDFLNSAS